MKKGKRFLAALIVAGLFLVVPFQSVAAAPDVSAQASILMTQDGAVLYENNANTSLPIASTTKIMSAMLALESGDLDSYFTVDGDAIKVEGSSMGLKEDDQVTMRTLVYGMLLASGNDAAGAAAVRAAGSVNEFVVQMNQRAEELGMENTQFATPSGLDSNVDHYSTARDMALLTREALKNPEFVEICSSSQAKVSYGNPPYDRWLTNHNRLLRQYDGAIGVKTGFTKKAGRCLVSAAQRDGVTMIAVVLNDPDDWKDSAALLDYGFSVVNPIALEDDYADVKGTVVGGTQDDVSVVAKELPKLCLNQEEMDRLERQIHLDPFYYAPVGEEQLLGEAVYTLDGKEVCRVGLYAAQKVELKRPGVSFGWRMHVTAFANTLQELFFTLLIGG